MPLLSYSAITDYPFQPFTKIFSADINLVFSTIQTLLNTTKLDSTNVQLNGLTRDRLALGTANSVVINDGTGLLIDEPQLALSRGGTGLNIVPSSQNPLDVLQINAGATALVMGSVPINASVRIFQFRNFG